MLIDGKDISMINKLKKQLSESFAMKDMGATKQILGIKSLHLLSPLIRVILELFKLLLRCYLAKLVQRSQNNNQECNPLQ